METLNTGLRAFTVEKKRRSQSQPGLLARDFVLTSVKEEKFIQDLLQSDSKPPTLPGAPSLLGYPDTQKSRWTFGGFFY